jgi:hypothetical protein
MGYQRKAAIISNQWQWRWLSESRSAWRRQRHVAAWIAAKWHGGAGDLIENGHAKMAKAA